MNGIFSYDQIKRSTFLFKCGEYKNFVCATMCMDKDRQNETLFFRVSWGDSHGYGISIIEAIKDCTKILTELEINNIAKNLQKKK